MTETYDLAVVGAGAAGLTAADFAARLGARVVLVEKNCIGGDCTWTGCVPSKALLKVAKVAHETRNAAHYGVLTTPPQVDCLPRNSSLPPGLILSSPISLACETFPS
jgi:pyruvate/2-oxoglutarate dehydrogenase complex dihydrolipoamide dehydrogenase (E3) component